MERFTEYHAGVPVIKDRCLLPQAMKKLARYEDNENLEERHFETDQHSADFCAGWNACLKEMKKE